MKTAQDIYFVLIMETITKEEAESLRKSPIIQRIKPIRSDKDIRFMEACKDMVYAGNTTYELMLEHCNLKHGATQADMIACFETREEAQTKYNELSKEAGKRIDRAWKKHNKQLLAIHK